MTKQQYIDESVLELLECGSDSVLDTTARIIKATKNLTYQDSGKSISQEYQIDILTEIKKRLVSTHIIKEAQESGCLMQSVESVMSFLKPATEALQSEINAMSKPDESSDIDNSEKKK